MSNVIQCPSCKIYTVDTVGHCCTLNKAPDHLAPKLMPPAASEKKMSSYLRGGNMVPIRTDQLAITWVPAANLLKWDFAMGNFTDFVLGATGDDRRLIMGSNGPVGSRTLGEFAAIKAYEPNWMIDALWNACVVWVKGDKKAIEMYEPLVVNDKVGFTSSYQNRIPMAFRNFGIGFRCEKKTDLERILRDGFQPLYKTPGVAESMLHYIKNTVMARRTGIGEMAIWKINNDAVGQTAICVSRSLWGATKFPEPNLSEQVYAFAVKPSELGYDTEQFQYERGETSVWRPGEKMFPYIPVNDIIAYTTVQKNGGGGEEVFWSFSFLEDHWTYLKGSLQERKFLDEELKVMRSLGSISVPKSYDFYSEPKR